MGGLISRWRKKPTTIELLEIHEKEIKELEEFRTKNQRLQKLWVGRLLLYSSVLYLLTSLVVYCLYLPEQWLPRLAMTLPFFIYPVLVWLIRKLLIFLFYKRTERNNDKLEDLKASKKKILEEVMETETYKNAKLILERFDPEAKRKAELESTPVRPQMTPRPGQEIRQRGVAMRPMPMMGTPAGMAMTPLPGAGPRYGPGGTPVAPGGPPERSALSASALQGAVPRTPCSPIPGVGMHPPGPPLARPILPKDRGAVDRVIEYLVGDGPQNRYALICQQCFSHNGMALKEEFEYLAFRCAYCYFLNPARKTRPQAPRLPEFSYERRLRAESRSPGPTPRSGTDTEESAPPSGAKAPAPRNLVHSFRIQQSPKSPQNIPLQSPDEKELVEDDGPTTEVESESQSVEQQQQQQQQEEEEEDGVQKEEEVESEQSHSAPCETESQPS
ncbi:endoplasmic reticulum junction formation protein lunapark-B isoform X1 [Etheostoma spectabile]|uniref:endoplasmic reticulum junction formation protein lunapark-B isoform X1 n=1 Tax=Etheostoma spectabile TaxID=54343 RepID=UPI0013AFA32B|nr:endoplasmic reticulum junction formation protein lunapark-B-like isoform X1 [Etheostoma spectabile]XP_032397169.1 endoplasmic reticulum junction formation protein lunapark-B-like isoform X1 [Etheostoma spectabile]XP_032397170.1 endoplasmic reticulum junction formation protein lunapark-B-like isoform X1 [Etheostoma spectabile]